MIRYSSPVEPRAMRKPGAFEAKQYARDAFDDLSDPILGVDWFTMSAPTFAAHPHAGFSAVTYLFEDSKGGFINRDSLGTVIDIAPGETHWTRAGSGIVHEETPIENGMPVSGLQIFVNLPSDEQVDRPGAYHVFTGDVRTSKESGVTLRTAVDGTAVGADQSALPSPVRLQEVKLVAGASTALSIPKNWGGLIIVLDGEVTISDGPSLSAPQAIGFAAEEDNQTLQVQAGESDARLILIGGERLQQPIHQRGPFILSSPDLLADRIQAFEAGAFGALT